MIKHDSGGVACPVPSCKLWFWVHGRPVVVLNRWPRGQMVSVVGGVIVGIDLGREPLLETGAGAIVKV